MAGVTRTTLYLRASMLGLPLLGRSHGALVFDVGGSQLRVSPVPSTQPSLHTVVGFADQDVGPVVDTLIARGGRD